MKTKIIRMASVTALKLNKKSPQILFGVGIIGSIATVVLASRAAIKAQDVINHHEDERAQLEEFKTESAVSSEDYKAVINDQYFEMGYQLSKLYAPVIIVGVGSLVCLTKSHQILTNRNTAITIAYTSLHRAMAEYRARVVNEMGETKDQEFLHGTVTQNLEIVGKNGQIKTKEIQVLDPNTTSPYSYMFDDKNPCWEKDPGYNHTFLENQQAWANIELRAKGYLFLSEVYRLLKIDPTKTSQTVGWVWDSKYSDGYVDFGFNRNGEFVAGYERSVWLDFNVDGPILDLI